MDSVPRGSRSSPTASSPPATRTSARVELDWAGGVAPYTLIRAEAPTLIDGRTRLLDEQPQIALDDPVLTNGKSYYYLVP